MKSQEKSWDFLFARCRVPHRNPDALPARPDRWLRVGAQRLIQQFVIDVSEVGGRLEIAVVQIGEARRVTVEPAPGRTRRGSTPDPGAVVGALRALAATRLPNSE